MSLPKLVVIKEDFLTLKIHAKQGNELIKKRMRLLMELKKNDVRGQSKNALSIKLGINHNSVVKWRNIYLSQGIEGLLKDGRKGGFKPSTVSQEEHEQIKTLLHDKHNGIVGYTELLNWVNRELKKEMKYITLVKYVQRHFGAKIKTARKSHVKKDPEAVAAFKKTSVKNASKLSKKKG
jgi:transposase